jgi:hypothetical protein
MRWVLALGLLAACHTFAGGSSDDDDTTIDARGSGSGSGSDPVVGVFDPSVTKVVVEIDYETNQQPYTGNIIGFGDTFAPMMANIDRLFAHKKTLTIPQTLPEMENIGTIPDEELTVADISAIANANRQQHDSAGVKTYYIVFVSGHYADGNGVNTGVLGVSFGDTIAMFKDVIKGTASVTQPNAERYVEQSTLIHELAHSIGLVDNGVPMVATHKDATHGAHCNNDQCVMYWLNEGAADARTFALNRLLTGNTIIFDAACLADVDAKTGGL